LVCAEHACQRFAATLQARLHARRCAALNGTDLFDGEPKDLVKNDCFACALWQTLQRLSEHHHIGLLIRQHIRVRHGMGRLLVIRPKQAAPPVMPFDKPMSDREDERHESLLITKSMEPLKRLQDRFGCDVLRIVIRSHHGANESPQRVPLWLEDTQECFLTITV
jgi:hypothetical protein